ncbi:DUF1120 domain-containing protein [Herbaspirillum sp. RTI4]|uniref:DUF1120 domain-containing protein n=1 Tax=Herbaspirillum sp. RTI4 TaxID=3048640 RepID=UPI002AB45F49|nr:DUF1120 domain-containing protein [Herbaspirillum sp. RTI4]MDY7577724.1 DUF1120 domain-containing protein [Herbaspirillum sp. RTI4]MEA9980848.1 DUF1120 domain-containing protein [Herbaspirillum sp. RTI4]
MNNIQKISGFAFLLGLAGYACAATPAPATAALTLSAKIKAPACNATISGTVDHGSISRGSLNPTEFTFLPPKSIALQISCDMDTMLWVKVTDDNTGADMKPGGYLGMEFDVGAHPDQPPEAFLGLGKFADGVSVGAYALQFNEATVINNTAVSTTALIALSDRPRECTSSCGTAKEVVRSSSPYVSATVNESGSWRHPAGKEFTFPIKVATTLNKGSLLTGTTNIDLAGKATMEIYFL